MKPLRYSKGYDAVAQPIVEGAHDSGRAQIARAEVLERVKAFIAAKGVRRFEPGASGDYQAIKSFLLDRGYVLSSGRAGLTYQISRPGQRGRPKGIGWAKIIALVDELRASEGLEPLKRRAA